MNLHGLRGGVRQTLLVAALVGIYAGRLGAENPAVDRFRVTTGLPGVTWQLNNNGEVLSNQGFSGGSTPVVWNNGTITFSPFGYLGLAINDAGTIAGIKTTSPPVGIVSISNGSVSDLGPPTLNPGTPVVGINSSGWIAANQSISSFNTAIVQTGSTIIPVTPVAGQQSFAKGINDSGHVVGSVATAIGQGFVWKDLNSNQQVDIGETTFIPSMYGVGVSNATAINNVGQVAGSGTTGLPGHGNHAFRWTDLNQNSIAEASEIKDLGVLPGGTYSAAGGRGNAKSINDLGMVAGVSSRSIGSGGSEGRAFLYTDSTGMVDLNDYATISGGSHVEGVAGINNRGQIVANLQGGSLSGDVLLTPELHWQSASSGSWDGNHAWSWGLAPSEPHAVFIDNFGGQATVVTGPAMVTTIGELNIGTTSQGVATLDLTNSPSLAIEGATTIGPRGTLVIGDGSVRVQGGLNVQGQVINNGTINFGNTSQVVSGTLLNGANATYHVETGGLIVFDGTMADASATPGGLIKTGGGKMIAVNSLAIGGPAFIAGGTLEVVNPEALSPLSGITLESDTVFTCISGIIIPQWQTLAGSGNVVSPNTLVFGIIDPGHSPGTLHIEGNLLQYGGSHYRWQVADVDDPLRSDMLEIAGILSIMGTSDNRIVLDIASLALNGDPGFVHDFDNTSVYHWTIAHAELGIVGFSSDKFLIDVAGFANDLGSGEFSLNVNGGSLVLSFAPTAVPEPGAWILIGSTMLAGGIWTRRRLKGRKMSDPCPMSGLGALNRV